jgi:AraC-like DNA-binding protein
MPARTTPAAADDTRYQEMAPPPDLATHLTCAWVRRVGPPSARPIVPDGCTDLMWITDGGQAHLVVAGPDTRAHPDGLGPGTSIAAVRFRPGAARDVFGVPLDALRDQRPDLADVWGRAPADALADAVADAERPEAVLARAVGDRLGTTPLDPAMQHVARTLGDTRVPAPLRGLADAIGLSERQLHRRCTASFGYGAKTLHRVLRFQRALRRAQAGDDLARVAHESGYVDQAHLARDVSALTDTTMTALLGG